DGREDRVVAAHGDVASGMELGAALAHQDVAGQHDLAAELLDAETAASGIAPVARGAACLFMGHGGSPLLAGADAGDLQDRLRLPVADLAPVVVAPPLLEDQDLVALLVLDHGRGDLGA